MDARELRKLWDDWVGDVMDEKRHPDYRDRLAQFIRNLTHVVSYLESEQTKREQLTIKMGDLVKTIERFEKLLWGDRDDVEQHPGLAHDIAAMKASSKRNGKLLWSLLTAVVVAIALQILKLH